MDLGGMFHMNELDRCSASEISNLKDAGCGDSFIDKYCQCEKKPDALCLLQRHRDNLLADLHRVQEKIDCLDYLIYHIRKSAKDDDSGRES